MNITEDSNLTLVNSTINTTRVYTKEHVYQISTITQIINVAITTLTVLLNCSMIKCINSNRSKIPEVIYKQLISLSISDVLAGLTPALTLLTLIDGVNRSSHACIIKFAPYYAAQYAVLLNLCVLSFRRWTILRKAGRVTTRAEVTLFRTVLYTLCPWFVSFLCYIPVGFVAKTRETSINGCLSPDLYENEMAFKILTLVTFATLLLLNVFSIISATAIRRLTQSNTTEIYSNRQALQRRAFKHLLAVLIVVNITTFPFIILSVLFAVQEHGGHPEKINGISPLLALNSLINPILYSANVDEIRAVMKSKILMCVRGNRNTESIYYIGSSSFQRNRSAKTNVKKVVSLDIVPSNVS